MKKILVSGSTFGPGGAARVVANLSRILPDHFDKVIVVLWKKQEVFYDTDSRANVLWVDDEAGKSNEMKRLYWFRSLVKQEEPDLILSFLEPYNIRVLLSTIGLHIKTIVAERNDPRVVNGSRIMDTLEKCIYHLADGILVQTKTIYDFFRGSLQARTTIIYNPVSIDKVLVGAALRVPKEKKVVCVARLMPQKRIDDLICAFEMFSKTHPDYRLEVYGEGPEKERLMKLIEEKRLENRVFLCGTRKDIHKVISPAALFVLVSDREGMSNAMIEAMCLGLPCVCTEVSGAIDLIESGVNGVLVRIGDIKMIVDAMTDIVDNPDRAGMLGNNAAKLYDQLNPDRIFKEWIDYLRNQS